jgi:hypothetical protein
MRRSVKVAIPLTARTEVVPSGDAFALAAMLIVEFAAFTVAPFSSCIVTTIFGENTLPAVLVVG